MSLLEPNEIQLREKYEYVQEETKAWAERVKDKVRCSSSTHKRLFPIISWLPRYPFRKFIVGDVISGLTTAIVRIPQGLAYGLLAGLLPINGLYTGFFSPLVYTIFGTSRHISVGVFSIVSLMLGAALDRFNAEYPYTVMAATQSPIRVSSSSNVSLLLQDNADLAYQTQTDVSILVNGSVTPNTNDVSEQNARNLIVIGSLSVLIGVNLILLGIFRLGIVAMFLSEPVVSGFTTAAAIYVVTAQMKYVTGIQLKGQTGILGLIKTWVELFSRLNDIYWPSIIVSCVCLVVLIPTKYINRTFKAKLRNIPIPVELFIVIMGTIVSWSLSYGSQNDFLIVGVVPRGMPTPIVPDVSLWPKLISESISIAIIIFAVAVSMGKIFAKKHGYSIDPNQELLALGFCQVTSGFFRGHSGGGALARSSVQESSGGNTQVASMVSCCVILMVLLVIGPLFEHLPKACLACIILANLHGLLMQFQTLPGLWRIDKYDFAVWVFTFSSVIILGIDTGLGVGVVFSLICGVLRTNSAKLATIGELVGSEEYGDVDLYKGAAELPGIKIVRFDKSPTYANKSTLQKLTPDAVSSPSEHNDNEKRILIMDCSRWNVIDVVGLSTLKAAIQDLSNARIEVYLSSLPDAIHGKLQRYGIIGAENLIPESRLYHSLALAIRASKKVIEAERVSAVIEAERVSAV